MAVGCQLAATVDIVNAQRALAVLIHIDRYCAANSTLDIAASEGVADSAAVDVEQHIAADAGVGFIRALAAGIDIVYYAAFDSKRDIACD